MFFFESFYYFYSLKTKLFYNEMKHIRLIFSAILLSLVVPCGYAQTRQDSLAIAHAQWHTDTLQHGAVCMYTNIHVFDSPQQISIIKYDPKKYKTQIVQAPQMTMTSHLAKENQAEAAINGSYFNVKTGAPTTFIRLDGIVRGETTRAEAFRTDGAISTDKNKIKIIVPQRLEPNQKQPQLLLDACCLMKDEEKNKIDFSMYYTIDAIKGWRNKRMLFTSWWC